MSHPLELFRFCPKCGCKDFLPSSEESKKCTKCGFEFFKAPAIGTAVFLKDSSGRFLFFERMINPGKGKLGFAGGFAKAGETVESAAAREVKEETNLDVFNLKFLFDIPNTYIYSGLDITPLDFYFEAEIKDFSLLKTDLKETARTVFLSSEEINLGDFAFESAKKAVSRFILKK